MSIVKDGFYKDLGVLSNDYVLLAAGGHKRFGNLLNDIPVSNTVLNQGLNADLLDGVHLSDLFTAFSGGAISSSVNTLTQANHSITIGGVTKTAGYSTVKIINSLSISKILSTTTTNLTLGITINGEVSADATLTDLNARYADNADKLDGVHLSGLFTDFSGGAISSSVNTLTQANHSITIGGITKPAGYSTAKIINSLSVSKILSTTTTNLTLGITINGEVSADATLTDLNARYADNADKLDGVHLNGLFTAFSGGAISSNGNTLSQANHSITIGGITKPAGASTAKIINSLSVSKILSTNTTNLTLGITINGEVSADAKLNDLYARDSDKLDGVHLNGLFTTFSGGAISSSGNTLSQANHSITIGGTTLSAGTSTAKIINSLSVSKISSNNTINLTLGITVNGEASLDAKLNDLYARDSDKLDGYHASGLFTNFSDDGSQNTSITIGGNKKDLKIDADKLDTYHANRFAFTYNSSDYGNSSSVTVNNLVTNGVSNASHGMIYAATDNPVGSANWVHVWSQQWKIGTTSSYVSQLALGVQQGKGMWYRTTSGNIVGTSWIKVLDSDNWSSFIDGRYLRLSGDWMDDSAQIYFKGKNGSTTAYASIGYRPSVTGTMHASGGANATKAFYIWSNGYDSANDNGGIAIDNEGVTVFGAGDSQSNFTGVFRVINEDNVSDGPQFLVTKQSGALFKYNLSIGQSTVNTDYRLMVNGSSFLGGVTRIQYNTPNLYIRNTVNTTYSIIRFGFSSNENASYIFQNGPNRTDDGGANTMTIRNNVGILRLQNRVHIDSTGRIYPEATTSRRTGMYGIYDSTKIGHIWSMGTAYMIPDDGSNFGNLYGLAYKHTNNSTGGTMAGGHQAVWCDNGNPRAAIGYNGVWAANIVYANGQASSTAGGISLYGTSEPINEYGIAFRGTGSYGRLQGVQSDWATYFTMNNDADRGWIFRRGGNNVLAIDGYGTLNRFYTYRLRLPGATAKPVGWYRMCRVSGLDGYFNFNLFMSGGWNTGAPTLALINFFCWHTTPRIVQITGHTNGVITKVRLINISGGDYYLDVYQAYGYTSSNTMSDQYFLINGSVKVSEIAEPTAVTSATGGTELTIRNIDTLLDTHNAYWANLQVQTGASNDTTPRFGYVGIGTGVNTSYRLNISGNSLLAGTTYFGSTSYWINNGGVEYMYDIRASRLRLVDNWVGFYTSNNAGGNRLGYIQTDGSYMYFRKENGNNGFNFNGNLVPSSNLAANIGTNALSWNRTFTRYIDTRHLDATAEYTGDMNLYIGYGAVTPTQNIYFYFSTGSRNAGATSRIHYATINSNGMYAHPRFGVNGQNTSYNFYVNGSADFSNRLLIDTTGRVYPYSTETRRAGMYGTYDSTKIGHIWSMGTSYMIPDNGANFGNLYGLAYKHTNNSTGGTMAGGHQAVWCDNGNPRAAMGYNGFWAAGGFYKNGYQNTIYVLTGDGGAFDRRRFTYTYNSANFTNSSGVTINQMAADGNSNSHVGMIYPATDNPVGSANWIHVWSQSWTIGSTANWVSQIALGVQQGTGMWYRTYSGNIVGRGWNRVLDSSNWTSYGDGRYVRKTGDTMTGALYINYAQDVGLNQNGSLIIGNKSGLNLAFDDNEIMARNNSTASILYINAEGGTICLNEGAGYTGIGTPSPSYKLHVAGDSYATGWSRAGSGFYTQSGACYYAHNGNYADISSNGNEMIISGGGDMHINYRGSITGRGIPKIYYWRAGSSSSYAGHVIKYLNLYPQDRGNWGEGIRIHSASNGWSTLILCGPENTGDGGTSANSWSLHANGGNFYLNKNSSNGAQAPRLWGHGNGYTIGNTTMTSHNLNVAGNIWTGAHFYGYSSPSSWIDGQRYNNALLCMMNTTDASSFWPIIRWQSASQGRWDTIGMLGNNLHFMSSRTSRTSNGYDISAYLDMVNGRWYSYGLYHLSYGSSLYVLTSDGGAFDRRRFTFTYNSANYNSSSGLTVNQMAADGNSNSHVGMIYSGTNNPVSSSGNWIHVWSQTWNLGVTSSWVSQIALGVQQGTGMWYRTTSGNIVGRGWIRVVDSSNWGSYLGYWANIPVSTGSNAGTQPTFNTCYTSNWFRSTGATGWYSQSYGGGIRMVDSTWIRTYGSKYFYVEGGNFAVSGNAAIGTTSFAYRLYINGDSYATGWSRAGNGFYCEGYGVHYTHRAVNGVGELYLSGNNEYCIGTNYSNRNLYFNYRAPRFGNAISAYIWNAGSTSSYAEHVTGHIRGGSNGTYSLGTATYRWYNGFFYNMVSVSNSTAYNGPNANAAGTTIATGYIEMNASTPYIDFKCSGTYTTDFQSRLINYTSEYRLSHVSRSYSDMTGYIATCEGNSYNLVCLGVVDLYRTSASSNTWYACRIAGMFNYSVYRNNSNTNNYNVVVQIYGRQSALYSRKGTPMVVSAIPVIQARWWGSYARVMNWGTGDEQSASVECTVINSGTYGNSNMTTYATGISTFTGQYIYVTAARPQGYDDSSGSLNMDGMRATGNTAIQRIRITLFGYMY